jgi:calcineurin-like phosphoesterase family protein
MNLYISDLHFGHKNVIRFDHRPFPDVEEMDKVLITRWNGRVAPDDDVYIVGDFAFHNEKPEEWYLEQLKGRKHLVIGNHDNRLLKNEKAMSYFEMVDKMMHVVDMGNQICLCHFPIADWNGMYRGSWHIYGHIHCSTTQAYQYMKTCERALNAGCMINNYTPASFQELVRNNREFKMGF